MKRRLTYLIHPMTAYIETLLPTLLTRLSWPTVRTCCREAHLPQARDAMFKSSYLKDLANNPGNGTIVAAKKQDLLGWNPKAPTTLCGGLGDPTVKFSINAQRGLR